MNKVMSVLEKYLMPIGGKLGSNKALSAVRDGIAYAMPLVLVGSMALLIANGFSIDAFKNYLIETGAFNWFARIYQGSFGIMALIAVFGIAQRYAEALDTDGNSAGVIALSAYIISTPSFFSFADKAALTAGTKSESFSFTYMGAAGLFGAILIGLITARIFAWFIKRDIRIKMPEGVPPAVSNSFAALIPGAVIIILFAAIFLGLQQTPMESIHGVLNALLGKPLSAFGGSLAGAIVVTILTSLFWFVGVHGGNITGAIMSPIWLGLMAVNADAYAKDPNAVMPHIVTQPFMDMFVYIGGGGATLGLVIALLIVAKSAKFKTLGKLIAPPSIFNINEPTMFGLPVVLNIYLLIPFILVPVINAIIAYTLMSMHIVATPVGIAIPWTMPPIISGFLATGSHISGAILQAGLLVLDVLLYLPFIKAQDRQELALEQNTNEEIAS